MPRKLRDARLDSRTARLTLKPRREPYWRTVQEGRALGYRRLAGGKAGSWIARHYDPHGGRTYKALGAADDLLPADGARTLNWAQAQERALAEWQTIERQAGRVFVPLTVAEAMDNYLADYRARGGKAEAAMRATINAHILPVLSRIEVSSLSFARIREWHQSLAKAPARLRSKATATARNVRDMADDPTMQRARRATANRILTVLKAALTFAFSEGRVTSDDAWRRVKPFKHADAAKVRYLTDPEAVRLVNACQGALRSLITAALLTGCRYAELANLRAGDVDAGARVLHVRRAKAGARAVVLTDEAAQFFADAAAGRPRDALALPRDDGGAWGKSHQSRPLREACAAAKIAPAASFHVLRHTFASRMAMKGVPMAVIAAALGNQEAICARHYAHLSPTYIADTIRQHAGGLGIVPTSTTVVPFRPAAAS